MVVTQFLPLRGGPDLHLRGPELPERPGVHHQFIFERVFRDDEAREVRAEERVDDVTDRRLDGAFAVAFEPGEVEGVGLAVADGMVIGRSSVGAEGGEGGETSIGIVFANRFLTFRSVLSVIGSALMASVR